MNPLPPFLEALGWALIHFSWQGVLIAVALGLFLAASRGVSGGDTRHALRYGVACGALLAMAVAPLITLVSTWPTAAGAGETIVHLPPLRPTNALAAGDLGELQAAVPVWLPWLLIVWSAGVTALAVRFAVGWFRLRRMVAGATPVDPAWRERIRRLVDRVGLRGPVRVLGAATVDSAFLVGCLRPVILLPLSALSGLPAGYLETVILHDLIHVRRWDPLVHRIQLAIETLLFYHPAVWWVSRVVSHEREFCCDAAVVRLTEDRLGYARALTELESLRTTVPRHVLAATGGLLMFRIQKILRRPAGSEAPVSGGLWALAALGLAVGLSTAALVATPNIAGDANRELDEPIAWLPAELGRWQEQFAEAADRYGVDADLLAIISLVESRGNPDAESPTGALGLMQIMPRTAMQIADVRGIEDFDVESLRDPWTNIDFGAWYLAEQMSAFSAGDRDEEWVAMAAAAYNGGPTRLREHLESGRPLTDESRKYSSLVQAMWRERNAQSSPVFDRWWKPRPNTTRKP